MIITDKYTTSRNNHKLSLEAKKGDILNIKKFNKLPCPVTACMLGGDEYWIESLCVQTGVMRLDVCGQIDISDFCLVKVLIDAEGDKHEPDNFWVGDEL